MDLEKLLKDSVEKNTPDYIKQDKIFDYNNKNEFTFCLTKELVEKLNLKEWFQGYKKEALVSTAGIRGPQNILYPHDTRFPINTIGITLATLAKALVLKEKYPDKNLVKLAGCEVRYNSKIYLDIISRIQSALQIRTLVPTDRQTIPIWLASFLAFKLDLVGAEYITSSHGICVKNATKDLNNQGSQFLPDESIEFVNKIEEILNTVDKYGEYKINFSSSHDKMIDEETMNRLNNGIDLYVEYLKKGVANEETISAINSVENKIIIDSVGGCAYNTLSKILRKLNIENNFDWFNKEETPFFHGIGKDIKNGVFYDWSLDVTVAANKDGKTYFPVVESLNYKDKLKNYPVNTAVLITDPDHDRLNLVQIVGKNEREILEKTGIDYIELDENRLLCIFSANQAFLMIMDYWFSAMNKKDDRTYFIIKTTASSRSWDEWAKHNGIKVINTPVGFKEIAGMIKKIEAQLEQGIQNITVYDVFNNKIELGSNPRMIFGGEESGGMIIGGIEPIKSLSGRMALAMREKSATEAIIVASALISSIGNMSLAEHLSVLYDTNDITSRYDVRVDIAYYNESEPDIEKLKQAKLKGEAQRTKNDLFYLALAVALYENKINIDNVKEILSSTFDLNFSELKNILFAGDGTYLLFTDKFVEIRPSGTDAKTKAYGGGKNKEELEKYANILGNYEGSLNDTYKKYLDENYVASSKEKSFEIYSKYSHDREDKRQFIIPEYTF